MMKNKLRYKVRLDQMNENRWTKSVAIQAGSSSKWIKDCVRTASKGGFFRVWRRDPLGGAEWNLAYTLGDMSVYSEKEWKTYINTRVGEYGLEKWKKDMESKQTLKRLIHAGLGSHIFRSTIR